MSTTVINDFKDLRKIIGEVTKKNPAKSRYQQQVEKMGYPLPLIEDRGMNPAEIERLRKAYVGIKTMDPTKPPGKKLLAFMRKLSKNQLQDIAGAGINFLSLLAVSNLIRMGIKPENIKYTKSEANENDFLKNLKKTNPKEYKKLMKFKGKPRPMKEGVFSRIAVDIDHGDNAQKVAKKYKLDLKVVKQMFIDIKKVQKAAPNFIRKNENDPLKEGEISDVEKLMKKGQNAKQIAKKIGRDSPREVKALTQMMKLMKMLQQNEAYGAAPAGAISAISKMIDKKYNISKIAKEMGLSPKIVTTIKKYIDDINNPKSDINTKYSKTTQGESRSKQVKEAYEHAKHSPFKLKSQQYPRAIPTDSEGYGIRHAIVDDIVSACETFGMITDKELQIEQIQKELGKKGFISYKKSELEDVFEDRETQRIILALESELEEQEDTKYTKRQIKESYDLNEELEFLKPDGMKSVGPILKLSGNTYNVKDKYTGKSFTYKYLEEENEMNYERSWTKPGQGLMSYRELAEATFSRALVNKAIKIAHKMGGNMTGAYKNIEKIKKGLADDPRVKAALETANEAFKRDATEGKLPPALQKAIDKKKGKKVDDDEDDEDDKDVQEVSIGPATIRKDFPNVWAQQDKKMNSILMALVNAHGYNDNLKAYKKDKKKFVNDLKKIGKNDVSLKKAGLTKRNIGEWVSKGGTRRRVKDEDKRISKLKEWEKAAEATGDKAAYQKFFNSALKKFGVDSPAELKGDKKKKFFNYVDKNWTADHEEQVDVHKSYRVDGRRKNFREKMKKLGYIKGI